MSERMVAKLKSAIRQFVPMQMIVPVFNTYVRLKARSRGYSVVSNPDFFRILHKDREIRLARSQSLYLNDTIENFDFYFDGVEPERVDGIDVVDYSMPRRHKVKNFDAFPVFFPAVAEPTITTDQYIDFAKLEPGAVVIDLGAYSGLTSILFDMAIPSGGTVLAIEADQQNIAACKQNFAAYREYCGRDIELIESAIWSDDEGVTFSSEGSMGSSVMSVVGSGRGEPIKVPSLTLTSLVKRFNLARVDFIKCDIEGGEVAVFDQPAFFARHSPKIMIECHIVGGLSTSIACSEILGKYGYNCELVMQRGYPLPLLTCTRTSFESYVGPDSQPV